MQVCDNEIKNVRDIQNVECLEFSIYEDAKAKKIKKAFKKRFEDFSHCMEFREFKEMIKSKKFREFILERKENLFFIRAYESSDYKEELKYELEIDERFFFEIIDYARNNF